MRAELAELRVVAISDRRRMVPAALLAGDWAGAAAAFGDAVARAVAGCARGSVIVQVREKDLDGGPLLALVRAAMAHAPVIVNDRVDVARAAGALGVHLPERGLTVGEARRVGAGLLVGVSRHAVPLADGDADLVQLGPVWPTPSKPTVPGLGPQVLGGHAVPVVAVGGIDSPARARAARAAGATAVAVIRAAWSGASLAPFVSP